MRISNKQRPLFPLLLLSICLLFLGINGLVGSYLMLSNPNGTVMGMPLSYLEQTPFDSWFIPGLCLLFIWGIGSFVILLGLWLRPDWSVFSVFSLWTHEHWAWALSILLGLGLLIWLGVQLFTLPDVAVIQLILAILAILLVAIPFLPSMRQYYQLGEGGAKWSR